MRRSLIVSGLLALAAVVAACGSSTPSPAVVSGPTGPSFPLGPVPGNSVVAALPSDAPAQVVAFPALPSCGAEVLFEEDVDITPIPTPPGPTTDPSQNLLGTNCLIAAWESSDKAQLTVAETTDEADEIFSMYRLPGDGTVQLIVRVLSHSDRTVSWTERTCRQLTVQDGDLTPADCNSETPLS